MDTITSSRKRNHSSPPPPNHMSGTFTRNRSELFLHRNRSGQARSDPCATQELLAALHRSRSVTRKRQSEEVDDDDVLLKDLLKKTKLNRKASYGEDEDETPRVQNLLTKDLRARRVYSPRTSAAASPDMIENAFPQKSGVDSDTRGPKVADLGFASLSSMGTGDKDRLGEEFYSEGQGNDELNSVLRLVLNEYRPDGDSDMYVDDATERGESGLCCNPRNSDQGNAELFDANSALQDRKQSDRVPSEVDHSKEEPNGSQRNDFVHERKLVQKPRFRGKLFKAPGSLSYKRMFPYLMDTTRDNPDKHKLGHYQDTVKSMVGQEPGHPSSSQSQEVSKHELKSCFDSVTLRDTDVTNHICSTSEQFCVENEECVLTLPPDAEIFDKSVINAGQLESTPQAAYHVKPINLTRSSQENPGAGFCLKAHKRKDSILKSKYVPRSNLHRKLFKTSGSISYRRMLPFLVDSGIEDSGTSKLGRHTPSKKEEANMIAKRFQLPWSSQSQEASIDEHKTDNDSMHDTVESNPLVNKIIVAPCDELPLDNQPKLTSSGDLPDLPMPLDAKEAVHECSSAPSINNHIEEVVDGSIDKRLSDSKFDSGSVTMDFCCEKNDRQHNIESPLKAPNLLSVNRDVSNLVLEHHSSKETELPVDYDEGKHLERFEKYEPSSKYPCEGQSVNHLDHNMLDLEDNVISSQAIFQSDDEVLNNVSLSNEEPKPLEKVIIEKSDMVGIGGDKAGVLLKGSNNRNAKYIGDIGNGSESKTIWALNGCSRRKLVKHAGSINYKRLLPFVLNTMKDHSCDLVNGGVPMERSSSISQIPESQSSHDSCKVTHLKEGKFDSNGRCKLGSYRDPPNSNHKINLPIISDSSVYSEVKGNISFRTSNGGKLSETYGCQSLSQPKVFEQLRSSDDGFRRGILKRNPRGCRGLCSCLGCVSFRLHAEKAFEFSRNQLLDADEVVQDLIKELSHLRNILERSTQRVNNIPDFDGSQVKEACMKAFETEQLAKDRLSQMNDDLQIHCRMTSLERPRVRFADRVEERVIQPEG